MHEKKRFSALVGSVVLLGVSGCGAPDIVQMKPTVTKISAEILLVDKPLGWNAADVQTMSGTSPISINVKSTSSAALFNILQADVASLTTATLFVVVVNDAIPPNVIQFVTAHIENRFEFIHTSGVSVNAPNAFEVRQDESASGYCAAWLAGYLASQAASNTVGWLIGQNVPMQATGLRAALGGLYASDARVNLVPVALNSSTAVLPKYLITAAQLSTSDWTVLNQAGTLVFSLVPQTIQNANLVVVPAMPSEQTLQTSLLKLTQHQWHEGLALVDASPFVVLNASVLSLSDVTALQSMENVIQTNPPAANAAWNIIPLAVQQQWAPFLVTVVGTNFGQVK